MAKINLLPWREAYRAEKKKEFITLMCVMLIVGALVAFGWDRVVNAQISNQESRNQLLKSEIAKLDKQVAEIKELKKRRQDLLDRMQVIQELQGNRPEIVKLYDEFVRAIPDGVYFTKMTLKGSRISLVGYAESNNRVSALMRQLDASYKFSEPNLTKVQADQTLGEDGSRFEMRAKVIASPAEDDAAMGKGDA
ncbi:PilN domain-containing protein [Porticoccus litoralis]|jgi:type IV pilus assembly protein PilN|uniref:PilN domain-containing protein n=1 Tax=Porticoccus litoralis TaxID=434086 RepID=A0AAW8B0Z7_9GAMM|nr:PilN domain-containing protein [Porticoccus litoralis]MDP1520356.1 PilN domain-containing protein [Porticoccus litoralis]TNE91513.1 MAG: pilus assembly protein PilN [Gammaproteobacteria bacterium]